MEIYEDCNNNIWPSEPIIMPEATWDILRRRGFHVGERGELDAVFYTDCIQDDSDLSWMITTISLAEIKEAKTEADLAGVFAKDSVMEFEVCYSKNNNWAATFAKELFYDIRPDILNPHVARYVRALNNIGVKTEMSSDGWYARKKQDEAWITYADRNSRAWHRALQKAGCLYRHDPWTITNAARVRLAENDNDRLSTYTEINHAAEYLEANIELLQHLKRYVVKALRGRGGQIDAMDNRTLTELLENTVNTEREA